MKRWLCLLCLTTEIWAVEPRSFSWETIELLAIQERGRLKPLHTFAIESLQFVTGKRSWKGVSAVDSVWGWVFAFDREWGQEPFIRVDHLKVKERLGLDPKSNFFTLEKLRSEKLRKEEMEIRKLESRKETLSDLQKKVRDVIHRVSVVEFIASGRAFAILPNPSGKNLPWFTLADFSMANEKLPYPMAAQQKLLDGLKSLAKAYEERDSELWTKGSQAFTSVIRELSSGHYPPNESMARERHYNELRPFRISWIIYAVSFVGFLTSYLLGKNLFRKIATLVLFVGLALHTYGFVLRCVIADRPPVTNMYESVIWVSWGCLIVALFLFAAFKNTMILASASVFSVVALVLADGLPVILDSSIQPLEPVLRSNFWLTIHVLTITLSYAAFALSLCLGNVALGKVLISPKESSAFHAYHLYMYRAVQVGVILLAAGTILGGVWADYSWGRFWGWDPKEVWALTALLLYLAILHGRFSGWLKGFGFVAATVLAFLGIVMAWYGVNFVLGVGLHSYGFGSGGIGWVLLYVAIQVLFIGASWFRMKKVRAS